MKRFLRKRWHGIPVGIITSILVVCLLAGGVLAAYNVYTSNTNVTVIESVEVTEIQAPGSFWDWHTQPYLDPAVPQDIYPGMDLGALGLGGKYLIHNISPQPVQVTVTVFESTGQTDWYGLRGFYSTVTHTAADTCNWDNPICMTNPGETRTLTFELGVTDYPTGTAPWTNVLADSSSVMFFIEAKVANDANPSIPLAFTVTVDR